MAVCIFPCYVVSFNLIFLFFSFRGGSKGIEKCPVAISDLVLIHNCVQEALSMTDAQVNNPNFNVWLHCSDLQMPYTKWSKGFNKRVANMLADERILPESGRTEDHCTDVVVEGFVERWKPKTKSSNQELKSKTIETQFLNEKKETYLQLSADFAIMRYSPKSKPALQQFISLLVLDIALLLGCDITWKKNPPSPAENSPAEMFARDRRNARDRWLKFLHERDGRHICARAIAD